jgi:glutamyl/glutaminyl-tRNA synthetase
MIVTRFAPSPTGYLHIGGARTALFNWLYARHTGGKFLLRIEDTDLKRNTPTATQQVIDDLRWLGIDWDQGPEKNGPNGPYYQSQRLEIYNKYISELLEKGKAYYCFDTPEQLEAMRQKAAAQKKGFSYQRPEVFPTEADVDKARAEGRDVTVRFCYPEKDIIVTDIVRGEVRFGAGEMGDFIIQKSDGFPTYHFACVVDDELMGVTHVIRGQEHLMNTPCHQALQEALEFSTPEYAHMSVTVSESGGKLSKRERPKTLAKAINTGTDIDLKELASAGDMSEEQMTQFLKGEITPDMPAVDAMAKAIGLHLPEINVVDFFKSGYLPETIVNFVALLGWNPGDKREIMNIDELIECFDINRLNKSNSLFDRKKLVAFNTEHIKTAGEDRLLKLLKDYIETNNSVLSQADDALLRKLICANQGARTLEDIEKKSKFIFMNDDAVEFDPKAVKKVLLKQGAIEMLSLVRAKLAAMEDFTEKALEDMLRGLAEEKQVGLGKVAQPLRVAICGNNVSPPIFDSVNILGRESTLARIDIAIKKFKDI